MKETGSGLRKKIRTSQIMLTLLSVFLLVFSAIQYIYIYRTENVIRVRFEDDVISAVQLSEYYEQKKEEPDIPDITLWKLKEQAEVSTEDCSRVDGFALIEGYGDLGKVMPDRLVEGGYPVKSDTDGCALSEAGAKALFGSSDVVGKPLKFGGKEYIIRGIVKSGKRMLWIQNPAAGFPFAEMSYPDRVAASDAKGWLMQQGYGEPKVMLSGGDYSAFNFLFITLPVWVFCIHYYFNLKRTVRRFTNRYVGYGLTFLWSAGLIVLIFAGIKYSFRFSLDYIPTRWSDFGFYSGLAAQLAESARSIAEYKRLPGDAELLMHSRYSAYCAWGSLALMIGAVTRRGRKQAK